MKPEDQDLVRQLLAPEQPVDPSSLLVWAVANPEMRPLTETFLQAGFGMVDSMRLTQLMDQYTQLIRHVAKQERFSVKDLLIDAENLGMEIGPHMAEEHKEMLR